jgi:hypothetical protein
MNAEQLKLKEEENKQNYERNIFMRRKIKSDETVKDICAVCQM